MRGHLPFVGGTDTLLIASGSVNCDNPMENDLAGSIEITNVVHLDHAYRLLVIHHFYFRTWEMTYPQGRCVIAAFFVIVIDWEQLKCQLGGDRLKQQEALSV